MIKIEVIKTKRKVCINIQDNAKGVPKKLLKKVFDLYFTTKEQGSGIGLYISKLIIEKHFNGSIKVTNSEGGAKFSVMI